MKVAITGADGFVGGFLVARLRALGHEVIGIGHRQDSEAYIDLLEFSNAVAYTVDGVDFVIHAAAFNETQCNHAPALSYAMNVAGTRRVVDFCLRNKIPKIFYLSTFHVFSAAEGVLDEHSIPVASSIYGDSHLAAEKVLDYASRHEGLTATSLRAANLFGMPHNFTRFNRWSLAPFDMCRQAIASRCIKLQSTGQQYRSFVSLDFLTEAILNANSDNASGIRHVGGGLHCTIESLAQRIAEIAKRTLGERVTVVLGSKQSAYDFQAFQFTSLDNKYIQQEETAVIAFDNFVSQLLLACTNDK